MQQVELADHHSLLFLFVMTFFPFICLCQSNQGVLYGKITLKNGRQYQGQIRWKNEQATWDALFDAFKQEPPVEQFFPADRSNRSNRASETFKFGFMELWADKSPDQRFVFRCHFGDIRRLERLDDQKVSLLLKNQKRIQLTRNRSSDLHKEIVVDDPELGRLNLDFEDLKTLTFLAAPATFVSKMGSPIYGRVLTTIGIFEGYITWDEEECLGNDIISGRQQGNKIDINFEEIVKLQAERDGSDITLRSGRTVFLNKHDDVSSSNNGIVIRKPDLSKMKIQWKDFLSLEVLQRPSEPPRTYDSFKSPKLLRGTVETNDGRTFSGNLVYDLDELYDIEILNGKNNDFEYFIPFRLVARIEPQNDKFSMVYLKDGQQYLLGGNSDVNGGNHGLMVHRQGQEATFVDWKNIKIIRFE